MQNCDVLSDKSNSLSLKRSYDDSECSESKKHKSIYSVTGNSPLQSKIEMKTSTLENTPVKKKTSYNKTKKDLWKTCPVCKMTGLQDRSAHLLAEHGLMDILTHTKDVLTEKPFLPETSETLDSGADLVELLTNLSGDIEPPEALYGPLKAKKKTYANKATNTDLRDIRSHTELLRNTHSETSGSHDVLKLKGNHDHLSDSEGKMKRNLSEGLKNTLRIHFLFTPITLQGMRTFFLFNPKYRKEVNDRFAEFPTARRMEHVTDYMKQCVTAKMICLDP